MAFVKAYISLLMQKNCFKCDNENVGMPGCSWQCSFSLERNETLKCETECKEGYIEVLKGICEPCNSVKKGCALCHYETNYPDDYICIKRERRI